MDDKPRFAIGREMAAAREADERRVAADDPAPSPLPPGGYDPWQGEFGSYHIAPLPYDEALTAFVRRYRRLLPERRTQVRDAVGLDDGYVLLAFARRCAVFAIRRAEIALVVDGLSACAAIGYERIDQRDALRALACLHHAAQRCGANPAELFEDAAGCGETTFGQIVVGFLARPSAERDLRDAWGLVEAEGPHGAGLLEWGFAPWMPTCDLVATSMRLRSALGGGDYKIDDPNLAVRVPAIWLSESGDQELEPVLEAARGAVVMHGHLRPDATPDHAGQQLTAWLVELNDDAAAARLHRLSQRPHAGHALLGVAAGPLFVLLVARSFVEGVASFEDRDSLARFEPAIRVALEG